MTKQEKLEWIRKKNNISDSPAGYVAIARMVLMYGCGKHCNMNEVAKKMVLTLPEAAFDDTIRRYKNES